MEKETVIIGYNQAPVTQKATDQIDEELRLAIVKTLKLSQIFFSHFVRISERGSKRHRKKKSQSQLCWSIPHFIRALLVNSSFYSDFAGQFLIFISLMLYFLLAPLSSRICMQILHDESEQHRGLSNVWKLAY